MKITISEQDLAKAPPQPQTPPPYSPPPQSPTSCPTTKPANPINPVWFIAGAGLFLVLIFLGGITYSFVSGSNNQTTAEFAQDFSEAMNQVIQDDPNHGIIKHIEDAHVSVTVKRATVTSCTVTTIDGSNLVGRDAKNVSRVTFSITAIWDGVIHKNGCTVIECELDGPSREIISANIIETDAYVNTIPCNVNNLIFFVWPERKCLACIVQAGRPRSSPQT